MTVDLSIVIPVFNESKIIPELYQRLALMLDRMSLRAEIVFIDDGSTDGSLECLRQLVEVDPRVCVIGLARNFGQQAAVMAGVDHCRGSAVVLMDGDLQDPPEVISYFVAKWREGYDVVYGIKTKRKERFVWRLLFAAFYRVQRRLANIQIPRDAGLFCLLDRRVVDVLRQMPERNKYVSGLRAWVGFQQVGVVYERGARYAGKPRQTLVRLFRLAMDGIFSFSYFPLRLAIYLGLAVSTVAFVLTAVVVYFKLFTDKAILGWASITAAILFLGGVELFTIGMIGEYIARIYDEVKQRPYYVIKYTYNSSRQ